MRPAIAVVIPQWVQDLKQRQKPGTRALYQVLPNLMQWHNYEFTEDWVTSHTVTGGVKLQLQGVLEHIQEMLTKVSETNTLVARITVSAFLPNQFILTVEPKTGPNVSSNVVLHVNNDGYVDGIARVFDKLETGQDKNT